VNSISENLRSFLVIIRYKSRLLFNTLISRTWSWSLPIIFILGIVWCYLSSRGAINILTFVDSLGFGLMMRWILALILIYVLILVFSGDLILGHTINAGQMSTDFTYLTTLPLSHFSILGAKLFERMITDWLGFLFLLSGFLGIACRNGITSLPIAISLLLYVEIELLWGIFNTLLFAVLYRFFRPSAVNNFFSLFMYFNNFLALGPLILISFYPETTFKWIILNFNQFQGILGTIISPAKWIMDLLIDPSAWSSFINWNIFWCCAMGICATLFGFVAKRNWLSFIHPSQKVKIIGKNQWLTGLFRKDAILLKSDFNLLTNALLLPATILIFQAWYFNDYFHMATLERLMNVIAGAALYFCMFGPMNAIGSEGNAINILETLPISAHRIIFQKTVFWGVLAEIIFLPAAFFSARYFRLDINKQIILTFWTFFQVAGFTWVTVSMSAIFPRFDTKILQQKSTLTGKLLACFAMMAAIPAKDLSWNGIFAGCIFLLSAISLHFKSVEQLSSRLDQHGVTTPEFKILDGVLILLCMLGVQIFVFFVAFTIFGHHISMALWPWLIAYLISMTLMAKITLSYTKERFPKVGQALGFNRCSLQAVFAAIFIGIFFTLLGSRYFSLLQQSGFRIFYDFRDIWELSIHSFGSNLSYAAIVLGFCVVAPITEEAFFRGFLGSALKRSNWSGVGGLIANGGLFSLIHPLYSIPVVMILGIACESARRNSHSLWPGTIIHAFYNTGILFFYAHQL